MKRALSHGRRGTTSLVALITVTTLSLIGGSFIVRITNRSREANQSASWVEASQMAESGACLALAEIRRVLPTTNTLPTNCWAGWTATNALGAVALPVTRLIPSNVTLTLSALSLTHAGEGNTTNTGTVAVDAPATLLDAAGQQWYRVRASGTAALPSTVRVSFSSVDRHMRRLSFVDWSSGVPVRRPHATRTVECIVGPVTHFGQALQAAGQISSTQKVAIDSFDSTDPLKSTSGEYDGSKAQRNGHVYTNGSSFGVTGTISGNLGTNGATVPAGLTVSGTTDSGNYHTLAPVSAPDWGILNAIDPPISHKTSVTTSTTGTPALYHVGAISAPLTLSGNKSKGKYLPSKVVIWVDGNITSSITVESGVEATIYVNGSINVNSTDLNNPSHQAANLQIYGIAPASGVSPSINVNMSTDVYAAIYAPSHAVTLNGNAGWIGSISAQSIALKGQEQIHYDESLALRATAIVDYRLVSWIEDVQ